MGYGSELSAVLRNTSLEALRKANSHDVIVVGAGAAGGWAAMLLTESGLRVLVLDASLPRALSRAPVRRLPGALVRRLATPQRLSLLPPALIPKARGCAQDSRAMAPAGPISLLCLAVGAKCVRGRSRLSIYDNA